MIYLFCNQGYGSAFIQTAMEYSRRHRKKIIIVFSQKRSYPKDPMGRSLKKLASFLVDRYRELRLRGRWKLHVVLVEDVNAPRFFNRISPQDFGIIAGFNQMFRKEVIQRFRSLVNFHPSILPLYRGPVPSYWCLKNREEKSGYTLHAVTERIDCGEILFQREVPVEGIADPDELDRKIASEASRTLWEYLESFYSGRPWERVQLDAHNIYKTPMDYGSFPNRG